MHALTIIGYNFVPTVLYDQVASVQGQERIRYPRKDKTFFKTTFMDLC